MHLRTIVTGLLLLASFSALGAAPATTNNNDSCDIGVTPAATLLLPYFEVDTAAAQGAGATTLFTITNTSRYPQIAHVTVWTDWSFPVLRSDERRVGKWESCRWRHDDEEGEHQDQV